ncbi:MAG: spore coat protein GerQ [Bacillus sp. (in: firmicutes)]
MKQSSSNPYGTYGYTAPQQPQQQPYYGTMPATPGQQPAYQQQPVQQQPMQQPVQQYVGGPLEASGGLLIPVSPSATTGGASSGGSGGFSGLNVPGMLPVNQAFIENILRLNKGKLATVYMTFENNMEWNSKAFKGLLEAAGRDHLVLADPQTTTRILLPMVHLDYITFEGELDYENPFGGQPMSQYSPR